MSDMIINAAPMSVLRGTEDLSTAVAPVLPEVLPTHLPKFYLYTQKGPTSPQLVSGADLVNMYGADSFDLRKKWANHATVFANAVNAKGNAIMVERVKPDDAAGPANLTLYLDVLATNVPDYQRNLDGTYKLDVAGNPLPNGVVTIPGFSIKWVAEPTPTDPVTHALLWGSAPQKAGDQVNGATQSVRYPIMDIEVSSFGDHGNNTGLRIWAPTLNSSIPLNPNLINTVHAYPFRMACISRPDAKSLPSIVKTQAAEQYVNVTFRPNTIDTVTDANVGIEDVFIQAYNLLGQPGYTPQYGPFGRMHLYQANVDTLLAEFYTAELPHINAFSDITGAVASADEKYVVNMISAVSSHGVPYSAIVMASGGGSIRLSEVTNIYASGGSDGTMNDTAFSTSVANMVAAYGDPTSPFQDMAKYPESIMYDSGFTLATKYALANFIALRKDTAVVISTYDTTQPQLSASEDSSLAIAIKTRLQMFPESNYYGTSTMRAMVVGRSGVLLNSQYKKPLPLSLEIAVKSAEYMGAGNGIWKPGFAFDMYPRHIVQLFGEISVTFTPASVRNKDWTNGLVWVENYDRRSVYFPALKTIYDNDTSVLNSYFTMMAIVELEKVGERVRRKYSGVSSKTDAQVIKLVNDEVIAQTQKRFDDRIIVRPNAYYTADDQARGYSWSLDINVYAPNMKTVQTLAIKSYRMDALPK